VLHGIWLVIKLGQEIMQTNNVTKFDDDPLKNIQVTEQTRLILAILAKTMLKQCNKIRLELCDLYKHV